MNEFVSKLIHGIVNREGGYVNHPGDKGGPTKYGITQGTLTAWRRKPVSIQDVKDLSIQEASEIYHDRYVVMPQFHKIEDPKLVEQVVDAGVNHGVGGATKMLQRALGVEADGTIGLLTLTAVEKADKPSMVVKFLVERIRYFARILESSNKKFPIKSGDRRVAAAGWYHVIADGLQMQKNLNDKQAILGLAKKAREFASILQQDNLNKAFKLHPKDQRVFAAGWLNRCAEMIERAAHS